MQQSTAATKNESLGVKQSSTIQRYLKLAVMLHQKGELTKAETLYRKILKIDSENADALHLLGVVAHHSGNPDLAIRLIERAISADSGQPVFYNNLGNVFLTEENFGKAENCFQKAIQARSQYAEAHYGLGKTLQLQGRLDEAIDAYNEALGLNPEMTEAIINLSKAYHSQRGLDKVITSLKKIYLKNPASVPANILLATAYLDQEKAEPARCLLENVLAKEPTNVDALFKLALAEEKLNQLENAVSSYYRIIDLNPNLPEAFINLGRIHKAQHNFNKAMKSYQKALNVKPNIAEVHNNLGNILQVLGKSSEAIASFRKALTINPGYALAFHNLGNTYQTIGQLEKAITCYLNCLNFKPDFITAYYHLGLVYQNQKKHEQAIGCFRKALLLKPDYTKATCYLFHQLQYLCDWDDCNDISGQIDSATLDSLQKAIKPDEAPFLCLSRRINPALDFQVAAAWSADIAQRVRDFSGYFAFDAKADFSWGESEKKIVIGYLSNNFRNHPTGHLMSGMFRHHNRDDFDIFCYSFGENDQSDFRKQIQKDCDRFVEIGMFSHFEAAKRIHHDQVNILVDLVGFTHGHRLNIAAMRPAPIQARWLGQAGTTGADFFDYIIMDPIVAPQSHAPFYSEQLVHMPHCYQVNNRNQSISDKYWHKEDLGLPSDAFVFCCFCSGYKLDPTMFDCWMRILQKVSNSVLWLIGGNITAEKNMKKRAQSRGVNSARLFFAPHLPKDEHLARLRCADLAIDTRIVNGAATTSDALWAGVPVLTLQGSHFASRMSSSIISAVGLQELITCNLETYETLAVRLAQNPAKLRTIKMILAKNRLTEPLFDTPRFVANLESAYKKMWEIFLSEEKPRQINVVENLDEFQHTNAGRR
jgi:protein O-GlcNAc transferase